MNYLNDKPSEEIDFTPQTNKQTKNFTMSGNRNVNIIGDDTIERFRAMFLFAFTMNCFPVYNKRELKTQKKESSTPK